jgi:AraC family transcriptional regulator
MRTIRVSSLPPIRNVQLDAAIASDRVESRAIGSHGATLSSLVRRPGHYRYDEAPEFGVMMLQNGGYAAEFDLGVGKFSVRAAPGQVFLSPPFTVIDQRFSGSADALTLSVAADSLAALLPDLDLKPDKGFRELYTRPLCDDFIRVSLNRLWAAARIPQTGDGLFADWAILALFASLARHGRRTRAPARHGLADWQLRRVLESLESGQDIRLVDLAAQANISPWYFARAFKQTTGVAPHHYQVMLRMNRAKQLLTGTKLPMTTVAERVGYGSSQTLARAFRKEIGTSPLAYRRAARA